MQRQSYSQLKAVDWLSNDFRRHFLILRKAMCRICYHFWQLNSCERNDGRQEVASI